jgi:hypothetical protein
MLYFIIAYKCGHIWIDDDSAYTILKYKFHSSPFDVIPKHINLVTFLIDQKTFNTTNGQPDRILDFHT